MNYFSVVVKNQVRVSALAFSLSYFMIDISYSKRLQMSFLPGSKKKGYWKIGKGFRVDNQI